MRTKALLSIGIVALLGGAAFALVFGTQPNGVEASTTNLEFYKATNLGSTACTTACPTSFTSFLTLTVDRRSATTTKDFLIVASLELDNTTSTVNGLKHGARLTIGGATVTSIGDGNNLLTVNGAGADTDRGGVTFATIATTTIGIEQKSIVLQYKAGAAMSDLTVRDGSIFALEIPDGAYQAVESNATTTVGFGANPATALSLSFTPSMQQDYLILGYTEISSSNWAASGAPYFRFKVNAQTVSRHEIDTANDIFNSGTNDFDYLPFATFYVTTTPTSSPTTIAWEMQGLNTTDDARMQQRRIIAIPLSGNPYVSSIENNSQVTISSTSWTNVLSSSEILNPGDHIFLAQTSVANEDDQESGYVKFVIGAEELESAAKYEHDVDDGEQWPIFQSFATSTGVGINVAIKGKTSQSGGADDATYRENRIFLMRVP